MKYSCVLFDLDGTLVDTLDDIGDAMNNALSKHGYEQLSTSEYQPLVGWGIKKLAFLAMPEEIRTEEKAAMLAADAASYYSQHPLVKSKAYPGMVELVSELKQLKVSTAVITNKPDPVARMVVEGLYPGLFDLIQGAKPGVPLKPDPQAVWDILIKLDKTPREIIIAGDSEVDIETAINVGCFPLGVSWGYREASALEAAGAVRIIDKAEELLELLGRKEPS
jgi:phosphoglycolate phosphatase